MTFRPLSHWLNQGNLNVPLSVVLAIPFVLQTVGAIVLVGYLSYHRQSEGVNFSVLWYGLTLLVVIAVEALTVSSITKPIRTLQQASQALANGEQPQPLSEAIPIAELKSLTQSFNQTAAQLQQSFTHLQTALGVSEEKFAMIFRTSPDPIAIVTLTEGRILEANDRLLEFYGYSREEMIGKTTVELGLWANLNDRQFFRHKLQTEGKVQNLETQAQLKSKAIKTVLIAAEVQSLEGQDCVIVALKDISDRKQLELELQASEVKLNDVLNSVSSSIVKFRVFPDRTWEYDYQSPGCELLFGYTAEEICTDRDLWMSHVFAADRATILYPLFEQIFNCETQTVEFRFHHKDGSLRWISAIYSSRYDEAANCWIVTGVSNDITDRKQIELALRQSESRFLELSNASPANIYILVKRGDGSVHFEYMSQAIETIHEIPIEDILANAALLLDRIHPDDRADYEAAVQHSLETLQSFRHEWRIITRSGAIKWLQGSSRPKLRDNGEVAWYGVVIDITDRKLMEQALQASEERYRAIVEDQPELICRFLRDGTILFVNDAYCRYFGVKRETVLGRTYHPVIYEADQEFVSQLLNSLSPENPTVIIENRVVVNGSIRWAQWSNRIISDAQGHLIEYQSVGRDITDRKNVELALERELLRNKMLLDSSFDGIVVLDHAGNVVEANPSFARMLGYSLEEVSQLNVASWEAQVVEAKLAEGLCQNVTFETRHRRKDGSIYEVEICTNSVSWHGETFYFCICRDITDRKQAEAALQASEARFQEIADTVSQVFFVRSTTGQFIYINPAYEQIWGDSRENLYQNPQSWLEAIHPDDRALVTQSLEQQFTGNSVQREYRIIRPDGEIRWIFAQISLVQDEYGQPARFIGVAVDITDRRQTENALRESEERFRSVFEQAAVGLEYTNLEGRFLLVNQNLIDLLGYSEAELLALNFQDVTHPDDLPQNQDCFQQLLAGEISSYSLEKRFIHKDRSHIWVNITVSLIREPNGQPKLTLAVIEDIRDRKQAALELQQAKEAAEAANVAKSMFLANMSHELRTPLNVILGYAQLLSYDTSLAPEYQEYLRSIHRSGNHLLALINDVLDLSKIEAGRSTFDASSFDLPDLMQTLWEMFRFRAESKALELTLELAEVPRLITTDLNKLRQVMINLLNNAVKFTSTGTIVLRVWVDREPIAITPPEQAETAPLLSSHKLVIEVEDTGIGIAPDELETIFEVFSQASAGKRSIEGTGLGLTISQKFVQLMGGQLCAESRLGQGSKFSVWIPIQLAHSNDNASMLTERSVIGLLPGQPHYRILVVDDQLANRRLLAQILQKVGLDVHEAASGAIAIRQWQTWRPHLIWMDIRMAGMTGYEAMQQIRRIEQEQRDIHSSPSSLPSPIPIIALTAQAYQHDRDHALAAGFTDFVTKPFRTTEIFQQLATYLGLQYLYADSVNLTAVEPLNSTDKRRVLQPKDLQIMPTDWIVALHKAALNCSSEEVEGLIAQIPADYPTLANGLQRLAHDYDFEIIMHLSQLD